MCDIELIKRLEHPAGPIDMVLDTDAYNEIDDQFAIAYMLSAPEKLNVKALYAAPFYNSRSNGPEDGMLRSYDEIKKILALAGKSELEASVFYGSRGYLTSENEALESEAARDLAARASRYTKEKPLYVAAIGAITNVASAIIMDKTIADKIVVVWLGGHATGWGNTREFNMRQDVAAARVVFDCGAAVVQLPCMGVVDQLRTTAPELNYWLAGKNPLADYLARNTIAAAESYAAGKPWSRVIWDVSTIAWLLDDDGRFTSSYLIPSLIPEYDSHYAVDPTRHMMRYVASVNRDAIFEDMFSRLA